MSFRGRPVPAINDAAVRVLPRGLDLATLSDEPGPSRPCVKQGYIVAASANSPWLFRRCTSFPCFGGSRINQVHRQGMCGEGHSLHYFTTGQQGNSLSQFTDEKGRVGIFQRRPFGRLVFRSQLRSRNQEQCSSLRLQPNDVCSTVLCYARNRRIYTDASNQRR